MTRLTKAQQMQATLKQELREVLSKYDLQILEQPGGFWLDKSAVGDFATIAVAPFAVHYPWEENRGARKGERSTWGGAQKQRRS